MKRSLKIISSNIRFANSGDGVHDWKLRKGMLQNIYQNFGPDILGTQEGRVVQIHELRDGLKGLSLVENHRTWIDERMYPCLFINPETVFVEKSGDIWLSETPEVPGSVSFESAFPRLCTWAKIELKQSGQKLLVVNTHLDHVLPKSRKEQIKVLIREIQKLGDDPVIVMGDFNESPLTEIQKDLLEAFKLQDPWKEKGYPEETSHHGFLGEEASGDRIDWILVPKSFECESINLDKRSFENGIFPSDHYPLLATVIPK
jgi:endonuclease/exonuclease/phosphatase family metal-dependent hydrolase